MLFISFPHLSIIFFCFVFASGNLTEDCPPIANITNGYVKCSDGYKTNSSCEYSCENGYQLDDSCLRFNKCVDTGFQFSMWQLIPPKCVPLRTTTAPTTTLLTTPKVLVQKLVVVNENKGFFA